MNDLEQAFRDALRRADTIEIPVPPIDPAEFTGSTFPVQPHQTWGCWLYSWEDWQRQSAIPKA